MAVLLDWIIAYRRRCFFSIIGITLLFASTVPLLKVDSNIESFLDSQSPDYQQYENYLQRFGTDRFVIAAVTTGKGSSAPQTLAALARNTVQLEQIADVVKVTSILDVAAVRGTADGIVRWPLVAQHGSDLDLSLDQRLLAMLRKTLPAIAQLISSDTKTLGLFIQLKPLDELEHKPKHLYEQLTSTINNAFQPMAVKVHISGIPVFAEAMRRYNVDNAIIFLACSALVGILIEYYIFKNLIVSIIIYAVSVIAIVWGAGLMALAGITLNPISGMAFGIILILTTMTVIHVATHYYDHYAVSRSREKALRTSLTTVWRPSMMCALTTACGFGSIMVSPVPTIKQFGFIMTSGALLSFCLVYLLLPFILTHVHRATPERIISRRGDYVEKLYEQLGRVTLHHPKRVIITGVLAIAVFAAGIPLVQLNAHVLNLFHDDAPEMTAYRFIQKELAPVSALNVVIEADPEGPLNADILRSIKRFETSLTGLPQIKQSNSFFRVLETIYAGLFDKSDHPEDLYQSVYLFQDVYRRALSSPAAIPMFKGLLDLESRSFCISLQLHDLSQQNCEKLVAQINALAAQQLNDTLRCWVTGSYVIASMQSTRLLQAQTYSLSLAFASISILLMIQFKSWVLGVLGLIPNLFPLAALIGFMGWFGVPLDCITVMVVVISFGLSIDDTIHYLTHLRQALIAQPSTAPIDRAVHLAYRTSAKALISTSAVLVFSFLTLVFSPFRSSASFGWLSSLAALTALIADLMFLPAIILRSQTLQRALTAGLLKQRRRADQRDMLPVPAKDAQD